MKSLTQTLVLLAIFGCGAGANDPNENADQLGDFHFAFRSEKPSAYKVQVDHLGLALTSTTLLNRSDDANCEGVGNRLQLLALFKGLVRIHRMWADDLRALGIPTCSMVHDGGEDIDDINPNDASSLLDYLTSVPCTLQEVTRRLPDGRLTTPVRVLDIITPDFATMNVDEPAGFPNGVLPSDQITDLVLAMGMADASKVRLDEVILNPPQNDVPFSATFPYLAKAHEGLPQ